MSFATSFRRFLATDLSTSVAKGRTALAGTVPSHLCYILLHHPRPPADYPTKIDSPLLRALQLRAAKWGGLVNFAWREDLEPAPERSVDGTETTEVYGGTAFAAGRGRLDVPQVSLANLDSVEEALRMHAQGDSSASDLNAQAVDGEVHLYVCTHGARDCRCGNIGGAVVRSLREELQKRQSAVLESPSQSHVYAKVKVGEVGHIGGHKYAGNVLVFPHGDWLGYMAPENVPALLDAVLVHPYDSRRYGDAKPLLHEHWRGRMGLYKESQVELAQSQRYPS